MQKIREYIIPDYDIFKQWRPEQHFQRIDKYSNYLQNEGRIETWEEVVARTVDTLRYLSNDKLNFEDYQEMFTLIYTLEVLPSMRLLSMSQRAIERCNTVIYNCSYGLGDTLQAIAEAQYLSMSGCGVSWSVERKNVDKIPAIKRQTGMMFYHVVEDSQIGWAKATEELLKQISKGNNVTFDYSRIRPSGTPLKTKGGYASGPDILIETHNFIRKTMLNAQGRKLTPLEMHDMFCYALESGVSGGVRRCLSDETLVLTNNGMVKIKDINIGDLAWTPEGYKEITNVFEQGKQLVSKLILANGTTVEATENHRFAVLNDDNSIAWKHVYEIKKGDKLFLNGTLATSGKHIEINIDKPGDFSKKITQLTKDYIEIDTDFAWIFGKFMADGTILSRSKNGVRFNRGISFATHTNESVQRERIEKYFTQFGVNISHKKANDGEYYHTNIVNGQIGRTFGDWKQPNTNIKIPHFIKESTADVRSAFLAGLADGDGCLHTKNVVVISTVYDTLRNDVIDLYTSLGIVVHSKTTKRINGWKNIHTVTIKGLSNKKNFVNVLTPFTTKSIYDTKLNMYDYNFNGMLLSNMTDKRLIPVEVTQINRDFRTTETFDIEVSDVHCFFANGILSHNSAGMCIFDTDEKDILTCKYDGFWNHPEHKVRANANNSAVWGDNLSKDDIFDLTKQLFSTGVGEPGLFKRGNAIKTSPEWRNFIHPEHIGTNPSLRKGTRILTDNGIVPIEELQDKNFFVRNLNGEWSAATCFLSGNNKQLYKITLQGGIEYYCTAEHKWPVLKNGQYQKTETTDILVGDILPENTESMNFGNKGTYNEGFFIGWLYGDGWITQRKDNDKQQIGMIVSEADKDNGIIEKLDLTLRNFSRVQFLKRQKNTLAWYEFNTQNKELNDFLTDFSVSKKDNGLPNIVWNDASKDFIFGLLDGLISSDGCVNKDGSIDIVTKHPKLAKDLLELLGFLGIRTNLYKRSICQTKICDKIYNDETIFNTYAVTLVANTLPNDFILTHETKNEKLIVQKGKKQKRSRTRQVISIEKTDLFEDVWDITVFDNTHCFALANIITGNCGEIYLQAIPVDSEYIKGGGWQFCNLSTIVARHDDNFESLRHKTKYATLIGDIQSLATNFEFLRPGTKKICEIERLLGVNLIGYAVSPFIRNNPDKVKELREYTYEIDRSFSGLFNVNPSAALTAVKPSGNTQVFAYTAPGANPIHATKQLRNVTVNKQSAMHLFLEAQSVPRHDYPGRDYASMFSFPIEYHSDSVTLEDCNAIEQLEIWKFHKLNWTDHNPSISITYLPEEITPIRKWLYENQNIIGGLAFFPKFESSYELLPIVTMTDEKYAEFIKDYPTIAWENYKFYEQAVDDRQQVAECAGGVCLIV